MRQGSPNNNRRPRGRHHNNGGTNNGNIGGGAPAGPMGGQNRPRNAASLRHQTFDSNGPDIRVRGNAWQVYEKYQSLARDAAGSGDKVLAESFLQHAEHYYRIIEAINEATAVEQRARGVFEQPPSGFSPMAEEGAEQPAMPPAETIRRPIAPPVQQDPFFASDEQPKEEPDSSQGLVAAR